jgi:homogentisate 1,2-dioxygenase
LIKGRNSPQKCPYGLYAEQLSGTSFTMNRSKNQRSWLYKIRPTVGHTKHKQLDEFINWVSDFEGSSDLLTTPDQLRWKPLPFPRDDQKVDFLHGISTYCGAGSPHLKVLVRAYILEWFGYSYV